MQEALIVAGVSAAFGLVGWLINKVYSQRGYELRDIKQNATATATLLNAHIQEDSQIHLQITKSLSRIEGYMSRQANNRRETD